ncbi:MAG: hypothetical protein LBU58_07175 [Clostridiales bacterium]|jgi:hypothetical protein|nr:hypothetical protein [Clostridiales bacterium]
MMKSEAETREEIIRAVRRMDGERLDKLHIFIEGLTAGRQRDAPAARTGGSRGERPDPGREPGNGAPEGG